MKDKELDELDEYERRCEEIREENEEHLALFERCLKEKGLSTKTIQRHLDNADLYLNYYLLYEDAVSMEEGAGEIGMFLGYFFIRKCAWSTPASIKSAAASIKKFYACMLEHGKVKEKDYQAMCDRIKEGMQEWQEECAAYNAPGRSGGFLGFD